ncbi:MAG: S1 RNA-binding domain-containing protein [Lachnospiraceae bacterium]|nr:S1 RNA-binding domain-containing protein [Lachnospiraceae bacterium]
MSDEIKMESMADFEEEINASFRRFNAGDKVTGTVVSVEEEEVILDLHSYSQGVIPAGEYSDDPAFHAMDEIRTGDTLTAVVIDGDDGQGRVLLSLKEAKEDEAWQKMVQALEARTVFTVKVLTSVNAGVVAFLEGIRGFIPASQLALEYVEDVDSFVGEKLDVIVITAEPEKKRLVLSAKEVAKERAAREQEARLNALQKGFITEGVIERIESYGCFVNIGDGLTGLVHISQICNKFLKSPNEVVKLGQKVKVKVLAVEEGKIRLSMKEAEDIAPEVEVEEEVSMEYHDEEATTSLAGLLAGIKIDE